MLIVGCAAWLALEHAAPAQTPLRAPAPAEDTATSQARALFTEGTEDANRGDWSQALPAFERSEALRPHAVTTYNIGFCERALGRTMRARKMLGKALAENAAHGGVELPDDLSASARTYLAELERRIARAVVSVSPADSAITVDGAPLERGTTDGPRPVLWAGTRDPGPGEPPPASTFELELDPGSHVLVASRDGYGNEVTTRTFEAGAETALTLTLSVPAPAPAPAPASASAFAPASTPPPAAPSRLPLTLAIVVGGAGLATGAIAGSIALAQRQKLSSDCPTFSCSGSGATDLSRADTAADVATAGFIVGGIGAATALVIWWLSSRSAPATARLQPWIASGQGGVSGTF